MLNISIVRRFLFVCLLVCVLGMVSVLGACTEEKAEVESFNQTPAGIDIFSPQEQKYPNSQLVAKNRDYFLIWYGARSNGNVIDCEEAREKSPNLVGCYVLVVVHKDEQIGESERVDYETLADIPYHSVPSSIKKDYWLIKYTDEFDEDGNWLFADSYSSSVSVEVTK